MPSVLLIFEIQVSQGFCANWLPCVHLITPFITLHGSMCVSSINQSITGVNEQMNDLTSQ